MRWLVLLLLFGCGDNLAGISLDQRFELEWAGRCQQLTRCGLFANEASCVAYARARTDPALSAAVEAGIVHFNPILERQCINDLAQVSCDQTSRSFRVLPLSCQGALRGARGEGQECRFDTECSTARCTEGTCQPYECCQGTCRAARKLSGTCLDNADCVETQYCSAEHVCAPLEHELGACINDAACDFGFACIGASSVQTGTCRKLPAIGEACPYGRCADVGARCDATMHCVRLGLPGDACAGDSDCSPFAQCNVSVSRCEAVPTLGMGCSGRCAGDAACFNGTCVAPLETGAPCLRSNDCESGLCAEPGENGYVCTEAPTCF
jgi:hypothetical protein